MVMSENAAVVLVAVLLFSSLMLTVYLKKVFGLYINIFKNAGDSTANIMGAICDCNINRSPDEVAEITSRRDLKTVNRRKRRG